MRYAKKETDINTREKWEKTLHPIVLAFEEADIQYHVDASSSLFFQGVEFEMEDLDLTVEWGKIKNAYELFSLYKPSAVTSEYPPSFRFWINSREVHIMSYESKSGIGAPESRVKVKVSGIEVWCKTIAFYEKSMSPSHRLWGPLRAWL